jgi:hypothetical protein
MGFSAKMIMKTTSIYYVLWVSQDMNEVDKWQPHRKLLVTILSPQEITQIINLERSKLHFGSQFWRFQSTVNWPHCFFGPSDKATHNVGDCVIKQSHLPYGQGIEETSVPQLPSRACSWWRKIPDQAPPLMGSTAS